MPCFCLFSDYFICLRIDICSRRGRFLLFAVLPAAENQRQNQQQSRRAGMRQSSVCTAQNTVSLVLISNTT